MESPTGIVPEELLHLGMKKQFLDWLLAQPLDGDYKLQILAGWGQVVGNLPTASDRRIVAASGWT